MPIEERCELRTVSELSHGYVGADLSALCKEAAMHSLRRILPDIDIQLESIPVDILNKLTVKKDDFLAAVRDMQPSSLREVLVESARCALGRHRRAE